MPEAAVRRTPGTRWLGATEKNRRHARRGHIFFIGPPGTGSNAHSPKLQRSFSVVDRRAIFVFFFFCSSSVLRQ